MPKNILIFSDGTGQAGGLKPDQALSNIYKLYRATRVNPDNSIDPEQQVAFYDAGLGTDDDEGSIPIKPVKFYRKALSGATGTGISRNIGDCFLHTSGRCLQDLGPVPQFIVLMNVDPLAVLAGGFALVS